MSSKKGIIRSILDTDLYKLTMMQAIVQLFPGYKVRYTFINRGKTKFPPGFDVRLRQEIKKMEDLTLTEREENFLLAKLTFFKRTFVDLLRGYRFDSSEVGVTQHEEDLTVTIEGYWYRTVLWEVPLMALICELYYEMTGEEINPRDIREKNNIDKGKLFYSNNMKVADFGTRRRYSFDNQLEVVTDLKNCFGSKDFLVGTSNVLIAMDLGLTPIGTHAHEWISGIAALMGYNYANKNMMESWVTVYQGDLGIALTDTFGLKSFLNDFDKKYAKLFDGVRHDSGDPFMFADKIIEHYDKLGIDPLSKTIVFSDGLNPQLAIDIKKYCNNKIKTSFGIGTNLTNDVGVNALNIVIKLVSINDMDVIKLSDNPGKHTGNKEMIEIVKKLVNYQS